MIRPILLAGVFALAAPAFAQNTPLADDVPIEGQSTTTVTPGDASTAIGQSGMHHDANAPGTTGPVVGAGNVTGTTGTRTTVGTSMGSTGTMTTNTGVGGPEEPARSYPMCSRSITDSCMQTRNSPRPN